MYCRMGNMKDNTGDLWRNIPAKSLTVWLNVILDWPNNKQALGDENKQYVSSHSEETEKSIQCSTYTI